MLFDSKAGGFGSQRRRQRRATAALVVSALASGPGCHADIRQNFNNGGTQDRVVLGPADPSPPAPAMPSPAPYPVPYPATPGPDPVPYPATPPPATTQAQPYVLLDAAQADALVAAVINGGRILGFRSCDETSRRVKRVMEEHRWSPPWDMILEALRDASFICRELNAPE